MLHQGLVRLILVHGIFAYHDVHPFLHFFHEGLSTLVFTKLNPALRERHLLICPVDVKVHELGRGPTTRDRPDPGGDEFFDNVTAAKYGAGQVKGILTASNSQRPLIELGNIHRGKRRDRTRQFRHINLQIKPVRPPIIGEVRLATRSNLDSGNSLSGILTSCVESATRVLTVVELPVFTFHDLRDDHQFVESGEGINARTAAEGLQNPDELRHFKERCRRKLVDFH
jgi:hypothetical protein